MPPTLAATTQPHSPAQAAPITLPQLRPTIEAASRTREFLGDKTLLLAVEWNGGVEWAAPHTRKYTAGLLRLIAEGIENGTL